MTDPAAIIASLTALVAALSALWVNVSNGRRAQASKVQAALDAKVIADGIHEAAGAAAAAAARASDAKAAAEEAAKEIVLTKTGVYTVGEAIDGRLTALLEATARLERATGRAEGIAAEQERIATGGASIPPQPPDKRRLLLSPVSLRRPDVEPAEVRIVQDPDDPPVRVLPEA